MAIFSIPDIRIAGISACVPPEIVSNRDYSWVSESERESIIKMTGVEEKRIVRPGTTTSDLCVAAAEKLLAALGWDRQGIGALYFVSQTRDYMIPATSGIIQDRLGLPTHCMAVDINQGCSGYIIGLATLSGLMSAAKISKGLLLVGDITTMSSYRDKSTYPLFGAAGTVTALEFKQGSGPMHFNLQSDGSGWDAIMIPAGGFRKPFTKKSYEYKRYGKGIIRNSMQVALDGIEVFNFSLREVAPNIKALLDHAGKSVEDFDYFVFHQANKMIIEMVRKKLRLGPEKVPYSIRKYGNTSSGSIPLTIVTQLIEQVRKDRQKLMLSGFGVGLSWGSADVVLDRIVCPELIEYSYSKQQ